jgi:putative transposase
MSSYRQLLYHLVFRTKDSLPTIKQDHVCELYAYITGIIKHKNSHLYRINGVENHLHILTDLHPSIALADFMRDVKVSSSLWMKSSGLFPAFNSWADGYGSSAPSELMKLVRPLPPAGTGGYSQMALSEPA